jgi:hypothetical protein
MILFFNGFCLIRLVNSASILEVRLEKAKDRINKKIGSAKAKNSIAIIIVK